MPPLYGGAVAGMATDSVQFLCNFFVRPAEMVAGEGIEPPTRGFSIRQAALRTAV